MLNLQLHGSEHCSSGKNTIISTKGCGISLNEISLRVAIGRSICSGSEHYSRSLKRGGRVQRTAIVGGEAVVSSTPHGSQVCYQTKIHEPEDEKPYVNS